MSDDLEFEWDPDKEAANRRKHGVDFATAARVFDDPRLLEAEDDRHDEPRWRIIGRVAATLLVLAVVYTERGACIRIISARPATRAEQRRYWQEDA